MKRNKWLFGFMILLLGCLAASQALAQPFTVPLYVTSHAVDPSNGLNHVGELTATYNGSNILTYGTINVIVQAQGADGILLATPSTPLTSPLIIGDQNNNELTEFPQTGIVTKPAPYTAPTAGGAFYLGENGSAITTGTGTIFTAWNGPGGSNGTIISANPITGGVVSGPSTAYTVINSGANGGSSTDVRALVFDTHNNTWYYGTAPDGHGATGEFGTAVIDTTLHTVTLHAFTTTADAHAVAFDNKTNTLITVAGAVVQQWSEAGGFVSSITDPIDNGTDSFDGVGLIVNFTGTSVDEMFVTDASSNSRIFFDDFAASGLVGTPTFTNTSATFSTDSAGIPGDFVLDDVVGSIPPATVPEPSSMMLLGLGVGLIGLWLKKRHTS